jgi:L-asparagine transporter-like permease
MKTKNSSSPVTKTLQSLKKSRAAGIVAAVVGAAAASAVGAALVKKARASSGKKKSAAKKVSGTRAAKSARRPSKIKGKSRSRSTAKVGA